jgi:hypothetical protein
VDHFAMKLWDAFVQSVFLLLAITVWWVYGALAGLFVIAMTVAMAVDFVRGERARRRQELAIRREIEDMGFNWEFFLEWCASEEEIERHELSRATWNLIRQFWTFTVVSAWRFPYGGWWPKK